MILKPVRYRLYVLFMMKPNPDMHALPDFTKDLAT
jgi:hypothetical protein